MSSRVGKGECCIRMLRSEGYFAGEGGGSLYLTAVVCMGVV